MTQRNNMLRRLLLVMMVVTTLHSWARPGWQKPVAVPQPDGTTVTLLMHGDEFLNFMTTTDGYTVVKGADGFYHYADKRDGQLVPTGVVARDAADRTDSQLQFLATRQRYMRPEMTPSQIQLKEDASRLYTATVWDGSRKAPAKVLGGRIDYSKFKGLVILVEFTDRQFLREDALAFYQDLTSKKDMKGYYDASGEHYTEIDGSVRDYFYQNSMGMFDPTFDVVGPVSIPFASTYPEKDKNVYTILKEALAAANDQVNYRSYDLDNNGYVDMVYFIFAGYGSYMQGNNENYIWPHASDLTWYSRYQGLRYDGMGFSRYACSVEIQDFEAAAASHQTLDGIGTMCHEFGHVLGLADHYDTDYEKNGQAEHPGPWDIMAGGTDYNGGYTPAGYNAYERYSLGFAPLQTIDVAGKYELEPFNTSNQFYRIATGTKKEFFYVENRQKTGWDRFLPGHGLLVWRVDSTNSNVWEDNTVNASASHMYFELLKARPERGMGTAYVPFPGAGNVADLTHDGNPALLSWAGQEAALDLFDIYERPDGTIIFNAGKNLYEGTMEDFEQMAYTNEDASAQPGVFTAWDLDKAVIASVAAEGLGNGERVAKLNRSGSITTADMEKPLRNLSFQVWSGAQQVRISLRENSSGSWKTVRNTEGQTQLTLKRNDTATLSYKLNLPVGTRLQIQMVATSAAAVAYVDDLKLSYDDASLSGIADVTTDSSAHAKATYNMSGQRVADGYRGIVVSNGRKTLVK